MKWVKVEEGLPKTYKEVLVWVTDEFGVAYWNGQQWINAACCSDSDSIPKEWITQ